MYLLEWRETSAGWSLPYIDNNEVSCEAMSFAERCNALEAVLQGVIKEVKQWQENGRSGYCLPVIKGDALAGIEKVIESTSNGIGEL